MPLAPGVTLGPYEILAPLGAGGMGEVYRARDTRLRRDVAVKVLPETFMQDASRLRRFEQEALAASALSHPNILTIHDVGSEAGVPFVVFELLEGETLRERLRRGALPESMVVDLGIQVANGMAAAHEKGIVHRDLKPENIFLTRSGLLKVLDFGLAKLTRPEPGGGPASEQETLSAVTGAGEVMGTVGYMSPEQVKGQAVDARSDLFSIGCVLYEMLAGRRAFSGSSSVETLSAILRDEPKPLSAEALPSPLERVLRRCLQKSPGERFQSARDLAFALRESTSSGSATAAAVATAPQPPAAGRPPLRAIAGGILILALAGALVLDAFGVRERLFGSRAAGVRSLAVLPLQNLSGDAGQDYFADGMTEALTARLAQIRALKVIARTSASQYKGSKKPVREIAHELHVDAVVEGSFARSGDRVRITAELIQGATEAHVWARSFERDLGDVLALQGEVAGAIAGQIEAELTVDERSRLAAKRPVAPKAYEAYLLGRFLLDESTEKSLSEALAQFNKALEIQEDYAAPHAGLASYYAILPFYSSRSPAEVFPKARAAAEKAVALDPSLAEAHASLAYVRAYYEWDWQAADREFQKALDLRPSFADAHFSYSRFLAASGRMPEAIAELHRAEELDPRELSLKANTALLFYFQGRYDDALRALVEISRADPSLSVAHWGMGLAYEQKGSGAEALAALGEAARLSKSLNIQASLAHAQALFGQQDQARRVLSQLEQRAHSSYVPAYHFVLVYAGLGEQDRAFEWLERAYQERSTVLAYLRLDPRLAPLRSDPRYADLVKRLQFPS
jgi:TolB-like protein/lipopolysaccharide biosynthesis regulator YciM